MKNVGCFPATVAGLEQVGDKTKRLSVGHEDANYSLFFHVNSHFGAQNSFAKKMETHRLQPANVYANLV